MKFGISHTKSQRISLDGRRSTLSWQHIPVEPCHEVDVVYSCVEPSFEAVNPVEVVAVVAEIEEEEVTDVLPDEEPEPEPIEPKPIEPEATEHEPIEPEIEPELAEIYPEDVTVFTEIAPPVRTVVRCRSMFDVLREAKKDAWRKRVLEIPPFEEPVTAVDEAVTIRCVDYVY